MTPLEAAEFRNLLEGLGPELFLASREALTTLERQAEEGLLSSDDYRRMLALRGVLAKVEERKQ